MIVITCSGESLCRVLSIRSGEMTKLVENDDLSKEYESRYVKPCTVGQFLQRTH